MSDSGDVLHDGSRKISTEGGDYVRGDQIKIIYGADAPRVTDYLQDVVARFGPLRERYIDLEGSAPPPPNPDDPFDNPYLVTPIMRLEGKSEPTTVQKALYEDGHDQLVMLGAPGAGKTTSLKVLLANAAERHLADPDNFPLPLLLGLGAWPDEVKTLYDLIKHKLEAESIRGKAIARDYLLLLDGLNEMRWENRVARVESINTYLREFPSTRVVVTCRERDYTEALDLKLPKLVVFPLSDDQVCDLINKYFREDKDAAEALWAAIQPKREYHKKSALLELVRNPYLLTLLAWIYRQNGSLPENTAKLFEQLVELRYKHEASRARPPVDFETFTHMLGDLAFEMIDQDKGTSVDKAWARKQMLSALGLRWWQLWKRERTLDQIDDLLRFGEACNVLADSGDEIRFYHQLMQEYFAALALGWRGDVNALASSWRLTRWGSERFWHSVLIMRAGTGENARISTVTALINAVQTQYDDDCVYSFGRDRGRACHFRHCWVPAKPGLARL